MWLESTVVDVRNNDDHDPVSLPYWYFCNGDGLEVYWENVDMKEARRVLNNKRNNATQAMKKKFKSKCGLFDECSV